MTKSQSGKKSPCFGLWCCCGRYHHSDSYAAVTHHPSSPSAFACIGRQQTDQLSCYCEKGAVWFLWQPLPLCLSAWFVSLCLSLTLPSLSVTLSPSLSLCPYALTVSSLTAGWREADARVYRWAQAPASTTRLFCLALWRRGLVL